ncbi:hypothetical protein [Crocinitomix catalasitica]|uniref:hypothetical protein n=1 Tax=Crocinitomix catalasitica TaxID=184607 RepID=UPI0006879EA9|nr:hypothetical protein [Crocinitomix catalasitica]
MKKSLDIQIEEKAIIEIKEAYLWYENQNKGLGKIFEAALDEAFKTISHSVNGFTKFGKHHNQFPMDRFPFVILYEATKTTLFIDAVFHTIRNPKDKLSSK